MRLTSQTLATTRSTIKFLLGATVGGILVSLATGLVENGSMIGLPEYRHYGFPRVWRVTDLNGPTEYILTNLAIDTAFWVTISLIALITLKIVVPKLGITGDLHRFLLPLALFLPLGLVMDFIHECGHGMWGTAIGGRLTYMKITYLQIYPRLAITPQFQLGAARVDGLTYGSFAYGLMLLGGAMTTNVAAWLIALVLLKTSLDNKTQVALKVLGLFGILDLPFYVVFPQMGLGHWIFFGGGCGPEPLTGARMMDIPDLAFYFMVLLSTVGLVFLYFKPLCQKVSKRTIWGLDATFKSKMSRPPFGSIVLGVLISLATGVVENPPEASIIGATYYGHPLAWRVIMTTINNTTNFIYANLAIDALFWAIISFIASLVIQRILERST